VASLDHAALAHTDFGRGHHEIGIFESLDASFLCSETFSLKTASANP
jgi:hypothetical protein